MDDTNAQVTEPRTNPKRRTPWNTVGGRVISLVSRKGGVGKTTSAVNLGAALALSGHNVLIVGTDPQCGVCRTLGKGPEELAGGLNEVFAGSGSLTDLAQPSSLEGLFFISPNITTLEEEELFLENMSVKSDIFAAEVDRARNLYDTILIDCPPSLGPPTQAALLASDSYLVPVQAEELCRGSVESLLDFVDTFRTRFFPDFAAAQVMPLSLEGLFLTMASNQTRMGRHVAAKVDEEFGQWMFEAGIPRNTRLSEMALKAKPAVIYDRRSKGSRAYFDLADELVSRFRSGTELSINDLDVGDETLLESEPQQDNSPSPEGQSGFDRFIAELGGAKAVSQSIPQYEEPAAPEMVSLDDLLAEEEDQAHSSRNQWADWDQGFDSNDPDTGPRHN
jgi:chromosome partitioning protein